MHNVYEQQYCNVCRLYHNRSFYTYIVKLHRFKVTELKQ